MVPAPDSDTPLPPDTRIGPWRLRKFVGGGKFGRVYKAVLAQQPDSPLYALKLARIPADPRFAREAEMLSQLHHPGLPRLHSTGVYVDGHGRSFPFLVMHFIPGTNLYAWAHSRHLTTRQVLSLLSQVARALEATHRHGLHRDLKGDNIVVCDDGHVVLLDFGACWLPHAQPLTDAAIPPGTEPYRSPQIVRFREQHWGEAGAHYHFQPEDDLYAMGVMVFYLLTGAYPSSAADVEHIEELIHPVLARLLRRLLSEEPSQRGTVRELAEELEQAATRLEPRVGLPVVATETPPPTEPWVPHKSPPRPLRAVHALGMAALVSGAFLLLAAPLKAQRMQSGNPKEDKVKLGSAALSPASPDAAGPGQKARAASAKVPGTPLPGQKRPPCGEGVEEIHKGCWVQASTLKPPCPPGWYEWKELCYTPLMASERVPTSEDP